MGKGINCNTDIKSNFSSLEYKIEKTSANYSDEFATKNFIGNVFKAIEESQTSWNNIKESALEYLNSIDANDEGDVEDTTGRGSGDGSGDEFGGRRPPIPPTSSEGKEYYDALSSMYSINSYDLANILSNVVSESNSQSLSIYDYLKKIYYDKSNDNTSTILKSFVDQYVSRNNLTLEQLFNSPTADDCFNFSLAFRELCGYVGGMV